MRDLPLSVFHHLGSWFDRHTRPFITTRREVLFNQFILLRVKLSILQQPLASRRVDDLWQILSFVVELEVDLLLSDLLRTESHFVDLDVLFF